MPLEKVVAKVGTLPLEREQQVERMFDEMFYRIIQATKNQRKVDVERLPFLKTPGKQHQ